MGSEGSQGSLLLGVLQLFIQMDRNVTNNKMTQTIKFLKMIGEQQFNVKN